MDVLLNRFLRCVPWILALFANSGFAPPLRADLISCTKSGPNQDLKIYLDDVRVNDALPQKLRTRLRTLRGLLYGQLNSIVAGSASTRVWVRNCDGRYPADASDFD